VVLAKLQKVTQGLGDPILLLHLERREKHLRTSAESMLMCADELERLYEELEVLREVLIKSAADIKDAQR
jgi:hypothetical protein